MTTECLFCKIIAKELPSQVIKEDDTCIVIKDIAPKAPIHYLIIPKKHIVNLYSMQEEDVPMLGNMMLMAQKVGNMLPGSKGFGIIINNGEAAGQQVFHLHCHFLSGKHMI